MEKFVFGKLVACDQSVEELIESGLIEFNPFSRIKLANAFLDMRSNRIAFQLHPGVNLRRVVREAAFIGDQPREVLLEGFLLEIVTSLRSAVAAIVLLPTEKL